MYDALLALQAAVTKTATFNGTGVDLGVGTPLTRALVARVRVASYSGSAGTGTATFSIDESSDNTTFTALTGPVAKALSFTSSAGSAIVDLPFVTRKRYVRLTLTVSGGTSPSIVYQADIGNSLPG